MTFAFSDRHVEEYRTQGYTVFRQILPPGLVADLRRASAAAGSLLLLVLVWPFLELTSALTTLMDTGMSFELAMGEPIVDVLIAAGSAALIWAVAVIIPED